MSGYVGTRHLLGLGVESVEVQALPHHIRAVGSQGSQRLTFGFRVSGAAGGKKANITDLKRNTSSLMSLSRQTLGGSVDSHAELWVGLRNEVLGTSN